MVNRLESRFYARVEGQALRHHHNEGCRRCCQPRIEIQATGIAEMILELEHGFTRPQWKNECIVIFVRQRDRKSLHRRSSRSQSPRGIDLRAGRKVNLVRVSAELSAGRIGDVVDSEGL